MSAFKVGQRVRVIAGEADGREGVILRRAARFPNGWQGRAVWECDIAGWHQPDWETPEHHMAPLTDPAADEWAADKVKQVTKPTYLEPVRTKEAA